MLINNFKFAIASLWDNKIRSLLTMLGVIIGVFSVITLISIGEGVRQEFSRQVGSLGSNLIMIVTGQLDQNSGEFNPTSAIGASTLTMADVEAITDLSAIDQVAPLSMYSGIITKDSQPFTTLMLAGSTENYLQIVDLEIEQGHFFTAQENSEAARVVILGDAARQTIFGDQTEVIGQTIDIFQEEFTVVGVLKNKEEALQFGNTGFNSLALIPIQTGEAITETNVIFRIIAKTNQPDEVVPAAEQIKEVMLTQHQGSEDFSVLTQEDILDMFDTMFAILTKAITGIAAISLIVGGIGIINIMLVSVTERTKEIGTRKALGATSFNILTQFLIEAATLSCLGGALGVAASFLAGQLITEYADIPTQITISSLVLAVSISIAVGILFGLMPAVKASRKSPIEALRYE